MHRLVLAGLMSICFAHSALAQELSVPKSPVLVIDDRRLFFESDFGKRAVAVIEARGRTLELENERIVAELEAEETAITNQRESLTVEQFRELAQDFDRKVIQIRRDRDAENRELNQQIDVQEQRFWRAAEPVMNEIMREAEAAVILDRRSVVLWVRAIDITDVAIARINSAIDEEAMIPSE